MGLNTMFKRADDQELCEQGGGPGLLFPNHSSPVPSKPYSFCRRKAKLKWIVFTELRSCVTAEVAVWASWYFIVYVDAKQHWTWILFSQIMPFSRQVAKKSSI